MAFSLLKRDVSRQFIKFCLIGLESTVLNYLVFLILFYYFSINYLFSAGAGFVSGVFVGFIFNKLYTFRSKDSTSKTIPLYFLVYLFSLVVTILGLKFLVESLGIKPLIGTAILIVITTIINFFGTKVLVFKNKRW